MRELTLFISHRSSDSALARLVIDLFEKSLKLPARQIRCTSVDGYRLPVGADTDEQLRREVFEARAFVGLITPAAVGSPYVLFELGARWGAKRHLAPVLAKCADASFLGGPLSGLNALRLDSRNQVIQFVEDIAEYLQLPLEPAASFQSEIDAVVSEASRAVEDGAGNTSSPVVEDHNVRRDLTDDEMVGIIRSWINTSGAARSLNPIYYDTVDSELQLPSGTAARLLEQAASAWYVVEHKGPNLIVFKEKPFDFHSSRRDRLKGFV